MPSAYASHDYEFYLRDLRTRSPLSGQLVPYHPILDADSSTELLFIDMGRDAVAAKHGTQRDAAFSYAVVWSPDSRRIVIEGGAHKFWHLIVYHRDNNGGFQEEGLPGYDTFVDYYRSHSRPKVKQAGALRRLRHRSGGFPDDVSYVCWLDNTVLAVNTYPYLLQEDQYVDQLIGKFELSGETFFMINFKADSLPSILGYCR